MMEKLEVTGRQVPQVVFEQARQTLLRAYVDMLLLDTAVDTRQLGTGN
jgi:hypothetical protein